MNKQQSPGAVEMLLTRLTLATGFVVVIVASSLVVNNVIRLEKTSNLRGLFNLKLFVYISLKVTAAIYLAIYHPCEF